MKIVVFENERALHELHFETIQTNFIPEAVFEFFDKADDFQFEKIHDYQLAIVDLSLSPKSSMDGFEIINHLVNTRRYQNIVIFTGRADAIEVLRARKLSAFSIIPKPMDIEQAAELILTFC